MNASWSPTRPASLVVLGAVAGGLALLPSAAAAPVQTQRVSVGAAGQQAAGPSGADSVSADGRFVVFTSTAANLVPGDTNAAADVFVRDRTAGTTERVSVTSAGVQASGHDGRISGDGRYVVFLSGATNLPGAFEYHDHGYRHDRVSGETVYIFGTELYSPAISSDGRLFAVSVWDQHSPCGVAGNIALVELRGAFPFRCVSHGDDLDHGATGASLSGNGAVLAFSSASQYVLAGDTNGASDVFLYRRTNRQTQRISLTPSGGQANGTSSEPSVSANGRFVAFASAATNLVAGDTNGVSDIFVRDLTSGATERVSLASGGAAGNRQSSKPSLSANGRYVVFQSDATNLAPDTNGVSDIFIRDRQSATTRRISLANGGVQATGPSGRPLIDTAGRVVAFESMANNLVPADTNSARDVFVRVR